MYSQEVRGINVVGPFDLCHNNTTIDELKSINSNWVCFLPEANLKRNSLQLIDKQNGTWTLPEEGYRDITYQCKNHNLKVILKPHIVLDKNISSEDKISSLSDWRGNINMVNPSDWELLEKNYQKYILNWARIAEEENVDAFIIGTELKSFVAYRPQYWEELIDEVKQIYKGPISYSANWDNFQNISFWDKLYFIGVNGYFPISPASVPSATDSESSWTPIKLALENISQMTDKKILITEYGYRNILHAGLKPWQHVSETENAQRADLSQYNLLEAFFKSLWNENYIMGGLLWNWTQAPPSSDNLDFSIQQKPAEALVREWYGKE